ncbi:single-stranded DNA-binding protein [Labedella endophytica]|nr:single-stranded DNA-binding protein [Labedella endophytica]
MADRVSVGGHVEAAPRIVVTAEGLAVASFCVRTRPENDSRIRLPAGSAPGRVLVTALGDLARSVRKAVAAGDRVVVSGVLVLRALDDGAVSAEVHAEAIGLDIRG